MVVKSSCNIKLEDEQIASMKVECRVGMVEYDGQMAHTNVQYVKQYMVHMVNSCVGVCVCVYNNNNAR